MKTLQVNGKNLNIFEEQDFENTSLHIHEENLIFLFNKNIPNIKFIGFTGEYKKQYTKVVYVQESQYFVSPVKKIRKQIINSQFKYIRKRKVFDINYIRKYSEDYCISNGYKLLNVGEFRQRKTPITIQCNKQHTTIKPFSSIVSGSMCSGCHGPSSLSNDERLRNIKDVCDEIGYTFLGYHNENGSRSVLDLRCTREHEYSPLYYNFVNGKYRCGECASFDKSSYKCKDIFDFIVSRGYKVETEYTFYECRNILPLPFDFYIPELNVCIEYDGEQHYTSVEFWGGDEALEKQKVNDNIKNNFCVLNGIRLLRIKYDIENYIDVVDDFIKGINYE